MPIHSVMGVSKCMIKTSCYCNKCLAGNVHDMTISNLLTKTGTRMKMLTLYFISSSEKVVQENVEGSERDDGIDEMIVNREERNGDNMGVEGRINVKCGKHVAVRYNEEWHEGENS